MGVGDGDNVFVADRDNIGAAAQYAQNMSGLGAPGIGIVGYSLGGAAAVDLANLLGLSETYVDELMTIDPVTLFGGPLSIGRNVGTSGNYYEQNGGLGGLLPWFLGNFGGTVVNGAGFNQPINTSHPKMPGAVFGVHGGG